MFASMLGRVAQILRRRWLLLSIIGGLFAAYTAGGFLLVPYFARSAIVSYAEKDLHRHVSIGGLSFNPFSLTAEIKGFSLTEADGSPIASFDLLRVNAEFRSLVYRAWTFKEVRIDKPALRVLVNADGSLNLAKLAPPSTEPKQAAAAPAAVPAVRVVTFAVHDGRVTFDDMSRSQPFSETLTPIEFTLANFRTTLNFENAYRFEASTEAGERLAWSGQFTVQPLGSTGQFSVAAVKAATLVSYLQDAIPFDLPSGTINVNGTYRVTIADQMGLNVTLPKVSLRDFAVAPKGAGAAAPLVGLPQLDVTNTTFSLAERKLAVERVDIANAKLSVTREADGTINLQRLMPASAAAAPATAAPAPAPASTAPAFAVSVATVALRDTSIDVEDRTTQPAAKFALSPVSLTVSGYSTDPSSSVKLDVNATIDGKGRVAAQGDVKLSPLTAALDLDIADIELPPVQPYVAQSTGMQLMSGQFSLKGKVAYAAEPARGQPGLHLTGDLAVANLATQDTALKQDFIKWKQLRLVGLDYAQGPDRLSIERVDAVEPYGRVIISSEQTLNVVAILNPPRAAQAGAPAPVPPAASKPAAKAGPMPIIIRTVSIENGSTNFSDFSIEPNFSTGIQALTGTVSGLSSAPNSRAQVKLAGNVDRFSPVDITGDINILSAAMYTDLALNFHNMELTIFNPYSGKYAGYNITKGKLSTELKYKVDNRKLEAQHHILLDQLEFGAATNSKDAVPLPVRLAVALLKDRNGVIDLNLPVGGSLDDPSFRVGPIIWQAFVNVLTKIVTAPFALLGSLFGGGEELAYVDFSAGSAALTPDQQDKLNKVANALVGRPGLKLDIPLETLSASDDAVLKDAAFEAAVAAAMPGVPAGPEQRLAALEKLYQDQMGMPPMLPALAAPDADVTKDNIAFLEGALRDKFIATQAQREALAKARAEAVQAAVLNNKEIMPERVFLVERPSGKTDAARMVRMELSLQ